MVRRWPIGGVSVSARVPSDVELMTGIARSAQVVLIQPGIVDSYDPLTNEVEVKPGVVAEDATSDDPALITATYRQLQLGTLGLFSQPSPGDHVTLLGHGLDASGFLALAPLGGTARANSPGAGITWEAWPGRYGPPGCQVPGMWLGDLLGLIGVQVTETGVQLGSPAATAPAVRGTELAVWIAGVISACAGATPPIVIPPPAGTLLSALVKVQ